MHVKENTNFVKTGIERPNEEKKKKEKKTIKKKK